MRRSQQYAGINSDADIVGVEGLHVEVKRMEKMDLYAALGQAMGDVAEGDVPIVMHRKNNRPWVVILNCEDIVEFSKAVLAAYNRPAPAEEPPTMVLPKRAGRVRRPSSSQE